MVAGTKQNIEGIYPIQWDDIRVPVHSTMAYGANAPIFRLFKYDGATGVAANAVSCDGSNDYLVAGNDFGDFGTSSYSISFWINTNYTSGPQRYVVFKNASFNVAVSNSKIVLNLSGLAPVTSPVNLLIGVKNHVVITVTYGATTTGVEVYQNNVLVYSNILAGALADDNANVIYVGSNSSGASNLQMVIDELRFYQAVLSASQVSELWAAGVGVETEPTGSPTLLAGYHFNDGSGTTADNYEGTAAYDITLTNGPTWVAGLVLGTGSRGLFTWTFNAGVEQELFFTCQLPHSYKEGTDLHPHIHWTPGDATAGNVIWGMEYGIKQTDGTFGNTTLITKTIAAGGTAYKHLQTEFDSTISGTGLTISSMLIGRIYRKGEDALDTYDGDAYLLEVDFHIQVDSIGSRQELVK